MDIIYILSALICYSGIFVGVALAYIAKEELYDGKKFFIFTQNVIISGIVFFLGIYFLRNLLWGIATAIISFFVIYFIEKKFQKNRGWLAKKSLVLYAFLGVSFFLSYSTNLRYNSLATLPVVSSLIFLFGFPTGSLLVHAKQKIIKIFLITSLFPLAVIIGYFIIY